MQFSSILNKPPITIKLCSLHKNRSSNNHKKLATNIIVALRDYLYLKRTNAKSFPTFIASWVGSWNLDLYHVTSKQKMMMMTHGILLKSSKKNLRHGKRNVKMYGFEVRKFKTCFPWSLWVNISLSNFQVKIYMVHSQWLWSMIYYEKSHNIMVYILKAMGWNMVRSNAHGMHLDIFTILQWQK